MNDDKAEILPEERENMIWSAIGSQSLAGVVLSYDEAAVVFDKVMQEAPPAMDVAKSEEES